MIELKELIRALRRGAPDNLRCFGRVKHELEV